MPHSKPNSSESRRPFDWRGWITLAWVVWFGFRYGKMVVEQRGGKVRSPIARERK